MHCNNKFLMLYSITPGFKIKPANFYKPISTRQLGHRPPGAPFFLLPRRKNRGRKTPRKAGGGGRAVRKRPALAFAKQMLFLLERERGSKTAPFTLSLPGARLGCVRHRRRTLYRLPGKLARASVPW